MSNKSRKTKSSKSPKQKPKTYHLVIDHFDRFDSEFQVESIHAISIKEAVKKHLGDCFQNDELTIDGENGRYAGEENSIGIGTSKETAALQYVYSRMEN